MSKLEQLRTSLLNMSDDDKLSMIRKIREDRKLSKAPIVKERKQHETGGKLTKMIDALSEEDRAALLEELAKQL